MKPLFTMKLVSYKFKYVHTFRDGEYKSVYELSILKSYLFGLIKKQVVMDYDISMFGNIMDYKLYWDNLIETGKYFNIYNYENI